MISFARWFMPFGLALFCWLCSYSLPAVAADDCGCPEVSCNSCEKQIDLKFYTEKCDGGKRVRSCKRPICEPMDPAPEGCMAQGDSSPQRKVANVAKEPEMVLAKAPVVDSSVKTKAHVGVVVAAKGKAWVHREGESKPERANVGLKIFERDLIETGKTGKIKILFKDKNTLQVTPESKMRIAEMKMEGAGDDRTMLDLMYGKIRSQVNKKYEGANNNYYRVRTGAAVAGVRGTDFVVSYSQGKSIETKVETLKGVVQLSPRKGKDDFGVGLESEDPKDKVEIPKGTYAKFVIDDANVGTDVFSDNDIEQFVAKGYLTPVYQLTEKELKILDNETSVSDRALASEEELAAVQSVCDAPTAPFNHCSWVCQNNPKGETRCRTDLKEVSCVRKRCNANGEWAEETRLPASFHDYCNAYEPKVQACDY